MLWLISLSKCPPGEFYYLQDGKYFERTPLVHELAKKVSDYRTGNKLERASPLESLEDIIRFTVDRLKGDRNWVFDTEQPITELISSSGGGGCQGCGGL